jgi:hypothetical protein
VNAERLITRAVVTLAILEGLVLVAAIIAEWYWW